MTDNSNLVKKTLSKESKFYSYWRPAMAWLYGLICLFDFILFPILNILIPVFSKGAVYVPWHPITLEGGGLIHMSFGGIIGVAAWTRGAYEKPALQKMVEDSIKNMAGNTTSTDTTSSSGN